MDHGVCLEVLAWRCLNLKLVTFPYIGISRSEYFVLFDNSVSL